MYLYLHVHLYNTTTLSTCWNSLFQAIKEELSRNGKPNRRGVFKRRTKKATEVHVSAKILTGCCALCWVCCTLFGIHDKIDAARRKQCWSKCTLYMYLHVHLYNTTTLNKFQKFPFSLSLLGLSFSLSLSLYKCTCPYMYICTAQLHWVHTVNFRNSLSHISCWGYPFLLDVLCQCCLLVRLLNSQTASSFTLCEISSGVNCFGIHENLLHGGSTS